MVCSPPGSSSMRFSRQGYWSGLPLPSSGIFQPRDWTRVSYTAGRFFIDWATREAPRFKKKMVNLGNQSWIFIGRTGAEAEAPILWPPDAKNWLIGKSLILGMIEGRSRRGWSRTKDKMVGWHHRLDGYEFEQALGVGGGQGRLVCYSPWGCKASDMTEQLNWIDKRILHEHLLSALPSYYSLLGNSDIKE